MAPAGSPSHRRRPRHSKWLAICLGLLLTVAIVAATQAMPTGDAGDDPGQGADGSTGSVRRVEEFGASKAAPALGGVTPRGVVRPEEFGARGDGSQDDSGAIQAALDAADGRVVELASGATYLCRSALHLPSHTTLVGSRSSVLRFTWTRSDQADAGGAYYIGNADQGGGNVSIVLRGFSVHGAGDGLPAGPNVGESALKMPAIRFRHLDTFIVQDLDVGYSPGISILYQGSKHGRLVGNTVHDSGRDGITGMWLQDNLTDIVVRNNRIERFGDDGIAVAGTTVRSTNSSALPTGISIENNVVSGWEADPNGLLLGRGIALLAVNDVAVRGNRISNSTGAGIMLRGSVSRTSVDPITGELWLSRDVLLEDNIVVRAGRHAATSHANPGSGSPNGIDIDRAVGVVAQGNLIEDAVGAAVLVQRCDDCEIEGRTPPARGVLRCHRSTGC